MAPMYYNSDAEVKRIADAVTEIARQYRFGNLLMANDALFMAGKINDDEYTEVVNKLLDLEREGKDVG